MVHLLTKFAEQMGKFADQMRPSAEQMDHLLSKWRLAPFADQIVVDQMAGTKFADQMGKSADQMEKSAEQMAIC